MRFYIDFVPVLLIIHSKVFFSALILILSDSCLSRVVMATRQHFLSDPLSLSKASTSCLDLRQTPFRYQRSQKGGFQRPQKASKGFKMPCQTLFRYQRSQNASLPFSQTLFRYQRMQKRFQRFKRLHFNVSPFKNEKKLETRQHLILDPPRPIIFPIFNSPPPSTKASRLH